MVQHSSAKEWIHQPFGAPVIEVRKLLYRRQRRC
jgi:hypothetical protein